MALLSTGSVRLGPSLAERHTLGRASSRPKPPPLRRGFLLRAIRRAVAALSIGIFRKNAADPGGLYAFGL
jgi:hypothetical protein